MHRREGGGEEEVEAAAALHALVHSFQLERVVGGGEERVGVCGGRDGRVPGALAYREGRSWGSTGLCCSGAHKAP